MLHYVLLATCFLHLTSGVLEDTSIDQINDIMPGLLHHFPDDCIDNSTGKVKKFCKGDPNKRKLRKIDTPDPPSRKKRSDDDGTMFWKCDFPIKESCQTCRRRIPKLTPITIEKDGEEVTVYPVYCPRKGGFQLVDEVGCIKQRCRRKCLMEWTFYTYMVTDEAPVGWEGYCDRTDLNVWFVRTKVNSHCVCPSERRG